MVNLFTTWHNATLNTLALFGERITRWRIAQAWIGIWNPCAKTPKMAAPECMMFDTAGSVLSQETLSLEPHKVNRLLFLAQYLGKQPGRLLAKSARPHVGLGAPSSPHLGLIFVLFAEYNIVLLCLSPACNAMSHSIFAKYLFGETLHLHDPELSMILYRLNISSINITSATKSTIAWHVNIVYKKVMQTYTILILNWYSTVGYPKLYTDWTWRSTHQFFARGFMFIYL